MFGSFRKTDRLTFWATLCFLGGCFAAADSLDAFGPPSSGDPSEFTETSIISEIFTAIVNFAPFEGGTTQTSADAGENNSVPLAEQNLNPFLDPAFVLIPTGGKPSPMYGAGEFEQQMLRFEEFGRETLAGAPAATVPFPAPSTGPAPGQDPVNLSASGPDGDALEAFLAQPGISPFPTQFANDIDSNPWETFISDFLGRPLDTPPAEGRPPGQAWAHQRWNEFYPTVYFKTAQAGARVNGGFRDCQQLHGYGRADCGAGGVVSEFAPGGLYNTVYKTDLSPAEITGSTAGLPIQFHPNLPVQNHKAFWTFDGTFPPKLAMARYGEGILMRHYNALPIDPAANRGFGLHTLTTHEHNGHNPAESDGYTQSFFFPGQFSDYRWPLQLAGYDTINTDATDPRAAFPCAPGETLFVNDLAATTKTCDANGRIQIRGDWRETMSTHWFHDHMLDFTAQNVYKGNASMYNYYSALDRGHEDHNDNVNLNFPSGTALPWGNRDYDVNLEIADKAWDQDGQLWFNIFNTDGFIGDKILTNWLYNPFLEVRARRYRFRILNASVSRYMAFALVRKVEDTSGQFPGPAGSGISYEPVPFHMIANDGNIMEHAVPFDGSMDLDFDGEVADHVGQLPVLAIAERYDIIVDFARNGISPGDKLYFVNYLEHTDGARPQDKIPLADILSEQYKAIQVDGDADGVADYWINGDPGVGRILELRVVAHSGGDPSMDPRQYEPGAQKMIPLTIDRNDPALANATRRLFEFGRSNGTDEAPWTIKTDGGIGIGADPRRISAAPQLATGPTPAGYDGENAAGYDSIGTYEIWDLVNGDLQGGPGSGGWSHPIHIHFEEAVILKKDGLDPPEWEKWARKDVFRIGNEDDSSSTIELAIRFREFAGTFMEHCHNTQHEDHAMLMRWDLEFPGQLNLMPTPFPTWDGVEYIDSNALPTFRTGSGTGPGTGLEPLPPLPPGVTAIGRAEGDTAKMDMRIDGQAPGASSITFHDGGIVAGDCPGTQLGSTPVDANEKFDYRGPVAFIPSTVCVKTSSGEVASKQVEINGVLPPPPPAAAPTLDSYTASSLTITAGESTTLSWMTTDATTVDITGVAIGLAADSMATVFPTVTTTYDLTANGAGGTAMGSITVTVIAGPPPPSSGPTIDSYTASLLTITAGESTTLSWMTTGATTVDITGVAIGLAADSMATVFPTQTTTYDLTANGASGTATSSITVIVDAVSPPPPAPSLILIDGQADPVAISFLNDGTKTRSQTVSVDARGFENLQLSFSLQGKGVEPDCPTGAFSDCYQVYENGDPATGPVPAPGMDIPTTATVLGPFPISSANTIFDLTFLVEVSSVHETATFTGITITGVPTGTAPPPPPVAPSPVVDSFGAAPAMIDEGMSAILSWSTTDADSVAISGVGTGLAANGSISVSPAATTSYMLTATAAGTADTATMSITVTVNPVAPPPPTVPSPVVDSLGAAPAMIDEGMSATLSWMTTNADSVAISGVGTGLAADGSISVSPTVTTTYDLVASATGTADTAMMSVTVTVNPPPPPPPPPSPPPPGSDEVLIDGQATIDIAFPNDPALIRSQTLSVDARGFDNLQISFTLQGNGVEPGCPGGAYSDCYQVYENGNPATGPVPAPGMDIPGTATVLGPFPLGSANAIFDLTFLVEVSSQHENATFTGVTITGDPIP